MMNLTASVKLSRDEAATVFDALLMMLGELDAPSDEDHYIYAAELKQIFKVILEDYDKRAALPDGVLE